MRKEVAGAVVAGFLAAAEAQGAVALYKAPGSMRDIDVGPGGQIYALGALNYGAASGYVYKWQGRSWVPFSGHGVRIAVDGEGNPWLVNSSAEVWRYHDGRWDRVWLGAQDIAAGGGQVFVVGTDGPGVYGSVARWDGATFAVGFAGGYGSRITVDREGHPWVLSEGNSIWRYRDGSWTRLAGTARSIDAGADGTVYMIGADPFGPADGRIFRWTGAGWEENGGYAVEIAVLPDGKPAVVNSAGSVWATFYRELPLTDFGHPRSTDSFWARGARPTLVILLEHSDNVFDADDPPSDYEDLFFGAAPSRSVDRYFRENSRGVFGLWRAGVVGPLRDPRTLACAHRWASCPGDGRSFLTSYAEALRLPGMGGVDFRLWDTNADGRVTDDELLLVFVSAYNDLGLSTGGTNRGFPGGCADTLTPGVDVCTRLVLVGDGTGLATIAHEMSHSLGMADIYGAHFMRNTSMSLMAATIEPTEDVHSYYHADPWHKMRVGWLQPAIVPIAPGTREIRHRLEVPQNTASTARPLILYDPNRGPREHFVVEFRNGRAAGGSFDADVAADGVVVWLVQTNPDGSLPERRSLIDAGANRELDSAILGDDQETPGGTMITAGLDRIVQSVAAGDDIYGTDKADLVVSPIDQALGESRAFNASHGRVNLRWLDWSRSWVELQAGAFDPEDSTVEVILTFRHR